MPPHTDRPPEAPSTAWRLGLWHARARALRHRFAEDRLAITAGSLTFTTLVSLVPLFTVMLALFSAFPIFRELQDALQRMLLQSVVPDVIARPVLGAVTQFAAKANRLGTLGLLAFLASALALMLTIDRTLNAIWRVRRPRPFLQRVLLYWAAITLGPLILGASVWLTTRALGWTRGWFDDLPGPLPQAVGGLLLAGEFTLLALAFAALYRLVPNTPVRGRHALLGGVVAAIGFMLARKGLTLYLKSVPGLSIVYGAFVTLPMLLIWVYAVWLAVLLGAQVAAQAPAWRGGIRARPAEPGWLAVLGLEVLALLARQRAEGQGGLTREDLALRLHTDPLQVETALEALIAIDWVGRLDEAGAARHVLLVDPDRTSIAPWYERLLVADRGGSDRLMHALRPQALRLADVLPAR